MFTISGSHHDLHKFTKSDVADAPRGKYKNLGTTSELQGQLPAQPVDHVQAVMEHINRAAAAS